MITATGKQRAITILKGIVELLICLFAYYMIYKTYKWEEIVTESKMILIISIVAMTICIIITLHIKKIIILLIISVVAFISILTVYAGADPYYSLGVIESTRSQFVQRSEEMFDTNTYGTDFAASYFADKQLYLDEEYLPSFLSNLAAGDETYLVDKQNVTEGIATELSEDQGSWILTEEFVSYPLVPEEGMQVTYFVLGEDWKIGTSIEMAYCGTDIYFVSEGLLTTLKGMSEDEVVANTGEAYEQEIIEWAGWVALPDSFVEIVEQIPNRISTQLILLCSFYLLGYLALWVFQKDNMVTLAQVIFAFPIGLGIAIFNVLLLSVLTVMYTQTSYLAMVILECLGTTIWILRKRIGIKQIIASIAAMAGFASIALYEIVNIQTYNAYDSIKNLTAALIFEHNSFLENLEIITPLGVFTASINSISYIFEGGALFAIYPLIYWAILLMVGWMIWIFLRKQEVHKVLAFVVAVLGTWGLSKYPELLLHKTWTMNNTATGLFMIILLFSFYMIENEKIEFQMFYKFIAIICMGACVVSRVEGAIYVAFFLCATVLMEMERKSRLQLAIAYAIQVLVWNGIQLCFLGFNYSSVFWSSKRGLLLCAVGLMVVAIHYIYDMDYAILQFIRKNVGKLAFLALFVVLVGTVFISVRQYGDMASYNLYTFVGNLTEDNNIFMWCCLLLLFPFGLLQCRNKTGKFNLFIIIGYMVLTFCICAVRNTNGEPKPLRVGFGDSARRMILQIQPLIYVYLLYPIVSMLKEENPCMSSIKNRKKVTEK